MLRKSIATVALSGSLADKLEAAASVGFDGVEVMEADLLAFDGSPAEVRQIALDLGLTIDLYQPFRDFEAMPDRQRDRNLDRAERKFDIMQALGAELVLVCSNTQAAALDDDSRAAADLHAMAERAAARGLRVGFEALSWGRHIRLWSHAWRIVQQADHPALGLILDSFHTLALRDDPAGIADVPGERIFFVQLADAPLRDMDVLSLSRHFRNFPAQGDLPVDGFVRAVLASGYRGPLSLEVFNDHFRAAPSRTIARDGLRSLILTEAQAGGATLPPIARTDGIEFLEFAVDEAASQALAVVLEQLGFRLAGRHRSKAVTLYQQGRLKLVLNAEQDSAASEHFQHHGPSVCAMALRVDDPATVTARARALLVQVWHEATGPGERAIPAVRGPDGTLIYLVPNETAEPSFWNDDFIMLPVPAQGSGLVAVDHVAIALAPGQMDTFVLFWRSLFGLQPQPVMDVPDPFGLVQSRAMVNAEGTLRLTFNVSEARGSATSRFLSTFSGAGVHHIALATDDIAASVAQATQAGLPLLTIPANYYEDLAARVDLDDAALAELERLGLLYDSDAGGVFRHAYGDAFQDRFFFELVERSGYTGFGAANAAVRMAAQARHRPSSF
ncbi:MAG: bifunctional sugar phosphate isomerase/epimerase/4-hydroxyphenylpyruvate dioxygenase family protein [Janthinobacterium lividum]